MSLIRKHVAVLQAWACLALVFRATNLLFYRLSQQKVTVIKIVWGGMKARSVGFRVVTSRKRILKLKLQVRCKFRGHEANFYEAEARCNEAEAEARYYEAEAEAK